MKYKYGFLQSSQIVNIKEQLRKKIFFLLLIFDPSTKIEYEEIVPEDVFNNVFNYINGLNSLLNYPNEIIEVMTLLESARLESQKEHFNYHNYRKLILDAGNAVLNIKEV